MCYFVGDDRLAPKAPQLSAPNNPLSYPSSRSRPRRRCNKSPPPCGCSLRDPYNRSPYTAFAPSFRVLAALQRLRQEDPRLLPNRAPSSGASRPLNAPLAAKLWCCKPKRIPAGWLVALTRVKQGQQEYRPRLVCPYRFRLVSSFLPIAKPLLALRLLKSLPRRLRLPALVS